jgi:hypothetical protein
MANKLYLIVEDQNGNDHKLHYQLADNPIAEEWIKKIKHASRIPLDQFYTSKNEKNINQKEINLAISKDIEMLNNTVGRIYDIKLEYDQNDCNLLHALTVKHQYEYNLETRDIFHRLHRKIHLLEGVFSNSIKHWLDVEWGEKGGPLTTQYKQSPYQYYDLEMLAGNIYQLWAEFGKTPYVYWKNKDMNNEEHFINNCKPHSTFRPGFSLCINDINYETFNEEFEKWFDKYRRVWQEKYNVADISAYGHGGVLLATPIDNKFKNYSELYNVKSIKLID